MNRIGSYAAVILVLLTNAFLVIGVARNRSRAGPEIELSARELVLPHSSSKKENTGTSLRIEFQRDWNTPNSIFTWLDSAKLKELGFGTPPEPVDPTAEDFHRGVLARQVYLALEFDGPRRREWIERNEKDLTQHLDRSFPKGSRLFPIDADTNAAALRRKYPDPAAVIITRCRLGWLLNTSRPLSAHIEGRIYEIIPDTIHVPLPYSAVLESFRSAHPQGWREHSDPAPGYAVKIRYGANHEPWVTGARLLPE